LGPGAVGKAQLEELEALVDGVLAVCSVAAPLPDRDFSLELPSGRLFGRLSCLNESALLVRSVGTLHTKRRMSAFIAHLALCATGDAPRRTELVGREKKKDATRIVFTPVDNAREQLESLLSLYRIGMCMPLPLFHDAAEAFARERLKGTEERTAVERAQLKLSAGRGQVGGGVLEDPHVLQVFGRERLLDVGVLSASDGTRSVSFGDVSEALFGSLLRHTEGNE
jgi:exonuclease V gamma subunit